MKVWNNKAFYIQSDFHLRYRFYLIRYSLENKPMTLVSLAPYSKIVVLVLIILLFITLFSTQLFKMIYSTKIVIQNKIIVVLELHKN